MSDPLSVVGSVVGIVSLGIQVTQTLYNYYNAFANAESDVAHILTKLESLLELLDSLHRQLKDRRFRSNDRHLLALVEKHVQECEDCIEDLRDHAEKFGDLQPKDNLAIAKALGRRLAYPFREKTLRRLREDVAEVFSRMSSASQQLQLNDTSNIRNEVEEIQTLMDLVRASQVDNKVFEWLKAPDATIDFNEACKKKHPGTGLWFVQGPAYKSWLEIPGSFLWLSGFAGCGKSVSAPRLSIAIAFFFFSFTDVGKQSVSSMLRSLVLQLFGQLNGGCNYVMRLRDTYRNSTPPDQVLIDCLLELSRLFKDTYIMIDAIDESPCDENREAVLETLLLLRHKPGLHLLVTSRDETDIRETLNPSLKQHVTMKNLSVDEDIARYISEHLRKTARLLKWSKEFARIETALTKRANGVLRWVECQFKALASCPVSPHNLSKLLESLPKTLDETYERMLLGIPEHAQECSQRILTALCCAKRPLTVPEVIECAAIELDPEPALNPDRRLENAKAIEEACPGLVEIYTAPFKMSDSRTYVRIAHFSVQEYLESERILHHKSVSQFHTGGHGGQVEMLNICLAVLNAEHKRLSDFISLIHDASGPLDEYAHSHWYLHFTEGEETLALIDRVLRLFQVSSSLRTIVFEHLRFDRGFNQLDLEEDNLEPLEFDVDDFGRLELAGGTLIEDKTCVYLMTMLGFHSVLARLLANDRTNVDRPVAGMTPLQQASSDGHDEIVRLLLEHGAGINLSGKHGNALSAAAKNRHMGTVQLLVDHNADVDAGGERFASALSAAAWGGNTDIVQHLLDHDADVNATGKSLASPLVSAVTKGHADVVQLLLDSGADVTALNSAGCALMAAAQHSRILIAKLLLEQGANVQCRHRGLEDTYHLNPLVIASGKGDLEVMKLLLEHGADPNAIRYHRHSIRQSIFISTPLLSALERGNVEAARLLLEHGADPNLKAQSRPRTRTDSRPLLQAIRCERNDTEMVELLLDYGANPYDNGSRGKDGAQRVARYLCKMKLRQLIQEHMTKYSEEECLAKSTKMNGSKEGSIDRTCE
ncbi:Ankyrin repeat and KH domain-containing protein 1 [Colletotrichum siamense]|uniref:Ankyrin repeat and KH domain-containing protein 1 n=1 Tax=Colletotrichum siamense TaxID=690259 RepID=A0A9P5F5X2_COLSI|nr:Ankyrin repeat and KH domain-containing protein 1 [Colletotrichum siamense]KAF4866853.1 Ankyrin repeat and KH domain-containing protein 1 [Colletotrichum siamense]